MTRVGTRLASAPKATAPPRWWASDDERLASLRRELDAIHERVRGQLGDEDVAHVQRIDRLSRRLGIAGRVLIHASVEPVGFFAGVAALAACHQLQVLEIGHSALHGAYDRLPAAARFHSLRFSWCGEIDEESWRRTHNTLHHGHTNIAGRDSDLQVGFMRWTSAIPYRWYHRFQLPLAVFYPLFWWSGMSIHSAGVIDIYARRVDECVVAPDKSWPTIARVHYRALRKIVPYKLLNHVLFPALAGPFFWKVLLGNWLADRGRDVWSAATIYCNHIGDDVVDYGRGERARSRGEWYAMQIEASNNFDVPHWMSILCGGLDRHIEHHLFPRLPPNRLREITGEIRAACARHGVVYRSASWPGTLRKAFRELAALSRPR